MIAIGSSPTAQKSGDNRGGDLRGKQETPTVTVNDLVSTVCPRFVLVGTVGDAEF